MLYFCLQLPFGTGPCPAKDRPRLVWLDDAWNWQWTEVMTGGPASSSSLRKVSTTCRNQRRPNLTPTLDITIFFTPKKSLASTEARTYPVLQVLRGTQTGPRMASWVTNYEKLQVPSGWRGMPRSIPTRWHPERWWKGTGRSHKITRKRKKNTSRTTNTNNWESQKKTHTDKTSHDR